MVGHQHHSFDLSQHQHQHQHQHQPYPYISPFSQMALNKSGSCNWTVAKIGIVFLGSSAASCPPCNCSCDYEILALIFRFLMVGLC
ncbi:hypothetical protein HanIR_Chr09g0413211 [Helianthus annuus]|nr:hypothetical protein HanIR_Chr09g0413211 [Helianthus annuus]